MTDTLSPDCAANKHPGCAGQAWDRDTDRAAPCTCPCHHQAMLAAMEAGAPWWLAREAIASTALDRDETVSTHRLPPSQR